MENQIVEVINYIKKISKKKLSVNRLLAHISNTTANDWDKEFVEDTLYEHFKISSPDNTITLESDETTPLRHISALFDEATHLILSHQCLQCLPTQLGHKCKSPLFRPFLKSNQ